MNLLSLGGVCLVGLGWRVRAQIASNQGRPQTHYMAKVDLDPPGPLEYWGLQVYATTPKIGKRELVAVISMVTRNSELTVFISTRTLPHSS